MSPIEKRYHDGTVNYLQVLCNTCWSGGKTIYQKHMGYGETKRVPPKDLKLGRTLARKHLKENKGHHIVIHLFKK